MTDGSGNPFESTQPARQYFVGRERELSELRGYLNTVKAGGSTNLYIVGGGGYGKTSFLYKIREENSGGNSGGSSRCRTHRSPHYLQ